jgi:sugar/nucleoside kinase (ribokinase family)
MGEGFEVFYERLVSWLNANSSSKLVFNPGSWQLRSEKNVLKGILEKTHLIYVNRQEAEKITGFSESTGKEKELLTALAREGPKTCVITDGGTGSFAYDGEKFYKAGVLPVDAYERTGAGDAFGSGCLSAIIKGKSFGEALLWGTLNSASVIGYVGPQRGLLKESELPVWLERAKSCNLKAEEL